MTLCKVAGEGEMDEGVISNKTDERPLEGEIEQAPGSGN